MLEDKIQDQALAIVELVSTCRNRFGVLTTLPRLIPFARLVQIRGYSSSQTTNRQTR
jgi:hypothetical protein